MGERHPAVLPGAQPGVHRPVLPAPAQGAAVHPARAAHAAGGRRRGPGEHIPTPERVHPGHPQEFTQELSPPGAGHPSPGVTRSHTPLPAIPHPGSAAAPGHLGGGGGHHGGVHPGLRVQLPRGIRDPRPGAVYRHPCPGDSPRGGDRCDPPEYHRGHSEGSPGTATAQGCAHPGAVLRLCP